MISFRFFSQFVDGVKVPPFLASRATTSARIDGIGMMIWRMLRVLTMEWLSSMTISTYLEDSMGSCISIACEGSTHRWKNGLRYWFVHNAYYIRIMNCTYLWNMTPKRIIDTIILVPILFSHLTRVSICRQLLCITNAVMLRSLLLMAYCMHAVVTTVELAWVAQNVMIHLQTNGDW